MPVLCEHVKFVWRFAQHLFFFFCSNKMSAADHGASSWPVRSHNRYGHHDYFSLRPRPRPKGARCKVFCTWRAEELGDRSAVLTTLVAWEVGLGVAPHGPLAGLLNGKGIRTTNHPCEAHLPPVLACIRFNTESTQHSTAGADFCEATCDKGKHVFANTADRYGASIPKRGTKSSPRVQVTLPFLHAKPAVARTHSKAQIREH